MGDKSARVVMDSRRMAAALDRIAAEIREKNSGKQDLILVGIRARGDHLAGRLAEKIGALEKREIPRGALDIGLYRDDTERVIPEVRSSEIPGGTIESKTIVLVDDVMYTGRTTRAALDALISYGRPRSIQLAVLVDRGHRELPIQPNYIGMVVQTAESDEVEVNLTEDGKEDSVVVR